MSKLLTAVRRAAQRRNESARTYRQAIEQARAQGHTLDEIGAAAGTSKQAVWNLLHADPRKEQT